MKTLPRPTARQAQKVKTAGAIGRARLMEAPEGEYMGAVREAEQDPLFMELVSRGVLRRVSFPGVSPAFFRRVPPESAAGRPTAPNASNQPDEAALELLARFRREDIQRFFLAPDRLYRRSEIARLTGRSTEEVEAAADLVNTLLEGSPGAPRQAPPPRPARETRVIARVDYAAGRPRIGDFSLDMSRGRYRLDEEALAAFRRALAPEARKRLGALLARLDRINARRSAVYEVTRALAEKQAPFLATGNRQKLRVLTQRRLARELGLDPSVVSRAVSSRAVQAAGATVPLRDLFPGRRRVIGDLIAKLEGDPARGERESDRQIARRLAEEYGLAVPRRTVNWYRRRRCPAAASGKRGYAGSFSASGRPRS